MISQLWRRSPQLMRWLVCLSVAALLLISLRIHDRLYREALPYAYAMLEIETQAQCEDLAANAIRSLNSDCESYVLYDRAGGGSIESIRIDGSKVNLLKSEITSLLIAELEKMNSIQVGVPLGSITDMDFLFGRGPEIKIELPVRGTVKCDITDSFTDAGINQTLHKTCASLTLDLILILPDEGTRTLSICEEFELARTVVVGSIPQTVVAR